MIMAAAVVVVVVVVVVVAVVLVVVAVVVGVAAMKPPLRALPAFSLCSSVLLTSFAFSDGLTSATFTQVPHIQLKNKTQNP